MNQPGLERSDNAASPVVFGFVDDLMDRSKISAALPGVRFVRSAEALGTADIAPDANVVVVIDLARHSTRIEAIRAVRPHARLVGFAPHIESISRANEETGVDIAMPRSRFFHDVGAALGYS